MDGDDRFETLAGATTSFSQLLFGDQSDGVSVFDCPPKMLCFGEIGAAPVRSSLTCSDSSPSPSSTTDTRKRVGRESEKGVRSASQRQRACGSKKTRTEGPNAPIKRKEKLGERISALQQLVSPFGKSDTASVLHEARGYIRFLEEQLQLLCSPYLQPSFAEKEGSESGGVGKDLRSRGLCLVPLECTVHVAETNGADFWSPSMAGNVVSSRQ